MRSIKTTTGKEIVLDGDLLAILEALFHEVTAKVLEGGTYEDMNREINHLVSQMGEMTCGRTSRKACSSTR